MNEYQIKLKRKLTHIHNSPQVNQIDVSKLDAESCRGLLYVLNKQEQTINELRTKIRRGY